MEPRPVGHMILDVPDDPCVCGHGYFEHASPDENPLEGPCTACNCQDFDDDDPDADYVPGVDDQDDDDQPTKET